MTAFAALGARQLVHFDEPGALDGDDYELCDSHPGVNPKRLRAVIVQNDTDFAAIAGIDQAGRVEDADRVLGSEARARGGK